MLWRRQVLECSGTVVWLSYFTYNPSVDRALFPMSAPLVDTCTVDYLHNRFYFRSKEAKGERRQLIPSTISLRLGPLLRPAANHPQRPLLLLPRRDGAQVAHPLPEAPPGPLPLAEPFGGGAVQLNGRGRRNDLDYVGFGPLLRLLLCGAAAAGQGGMVEPRWGCQCRTRSTVACILCR